MSELHPYHAIAYRFWLNGYDLGTLYPPRVFKKHCEAIKAFSGADVSAPLTASTNAESFQELTILRRDDDEGGRAPTDASDILRVSVGGGKVSKSMCTRNEGLEMPLTRISRESQKEAPRLGQRPNVGVPEFP